MRKQFENLDIHCWEHVGVRLGVKRPFICLQAAPEACDHLLGAVDELAAEKAAAQRMLTTKRGQSSTACSKIRLLLAAASDALQKCRLRLIGAQPFSNSRRRA